MTVGGREGVVKKDFLITLVRNDHMDRSGRRTVSDIIVCGVGAGQSDSAGLSTVTGSTASASASCCTCWLWLSGRTVGGRVLLEEGDGDGVRGRSWQLAPQWTLALGWVILRTTPYNTPKFCGRK